MAVTIVSNVVTNEYFFSTKHSTPEGLGNEWVAISWNTRTKEEVKAKEDYYGKEIPHPIPELQG